MSEQVYAGIHYFTSQRTEINASEKLAKVIDRLNDRLEQMYQRVIDVMADTVISKLDL
ncbi:MAG: hypothetical protein ACREHC_03670 [Candidatus Levyibacteriota bacterium]